MTSIKRIIRDSLELTYTKSYNLWDDAFTYTIRLIKWNGPVGSESSREVRNKLETHDRKEADIFCKSLENLFFDLSKKSQ